MSNWSTRQAVSMGYVLSTTIGDGYASDTIVKDPSLVRFYGFEENGRLTVGCAKEDAHLLRGWGGARFCLP